MACRTTFRAGLVRKVRPFYQVGRPEAHQMLAHRDRTELEDAALARDPAVGSTTECMEEVDAVVLEAGAVEPWKRSDARGTWRSSVCCGAPARLLPPAKGRGEEREDACGAGLLGLGAGVWGCGAKRKCTDFHTGEEGRRGHEAHPRKSGGETVKQEGVTSRGLRL